MIDNNINVIIRLDSSNPESKDEFIITHDSMIKGRYNRLNSQMIVSVLRDIADSIDQQMASEKQKH